MRAVVLRTITTFFIWILSHRQFNFSFFVRASSSYYPVSKHARRTKSSNRKISRRSIKIWRGEFIYFILLCIFCLLGISSAFPLKIRSSPHGGRWDSETKIELLVVFSLKIKQKPISIRDWHHLWFNKTWRLNIGYSVTRRTQIWRHNGQRVHLAQ